MTTSPFELAARTLLSAAMGVILIGYVRQSLRQGYAVGIWWDFQRDGEPKRFWLWIAFVAVTAVGQLWAAATHVTELSGI